ncbi:MAG: ATP-binding protein [Cuniculiplasma sp.]
MVLDSDYLQIGGIKKIISEHIKLESMAEEKGKLKESTLYCEKIISNLKMLKKLDSNSPSYDNLIASWEKRKTELLNSNDITKSVREKNKTVKSEGKGLIGQMEKEFRERILSLISDSKVKWSEIGGLEEQKNTIKEAVFFAMAQPDLDVKVPNLKNILLFGPPGTGKTTIAKAISSNIDATFFNVPVSELMSRYVGDSERIVSSLYGVAREKSPAVVFLDEIESLLRQRGDGNKNAGAVLQQFLAQLDGFSTDESFVMTVAATNVPWELDQAILSRFEKRIYIGLPDVETRKKILEIHTLKKGYQVETSIQSIAEKTTDFSGRDLSFLCSEAIRNMLRRTNRDLMKDTDRVIGGGEKVTYRVNPIEDRDFYDALLKIKPATNNEMNKKYQDWREEFANN